MEKGKGTECGFRAPNVIYPWPNRAAFNIRAEFKFGLDSDPKCCEYRQEVKGVIERPVGNPIRSRIYDGYLKSDEFGEDGSVGDNGDMLPYGHRDIGNLIGRRRSIGQTYVGWSRYSYFGYIAHDEPGSPYANNYRMTLTFKGQIIDVCKGQASPKSSWVTAQNGGPFYWSVNVPH